MIPKTFDSRSKVKLSTDIDVIHCEANSGSMWIAHYDTVLTGYRLVVVLNIKQCIDLIVLASR